MVIRHRQIDAAERSAAAAESSSESGASLARSQKTSVRIASIARQFQEEVRDFYGGRRRFTKRQKDISRRYRACAKFGVLDFNTYLIRARVLLDRTIGLSRRFLKGYERLPSFSSFSDHKKFLRKHGADFADEHSRYVDEIVDGTDWFEMPLKTVRDKFIVHSPPRHVPMLGWPCDHDLLIEFVLDRREANPRVISCSIRRLARDIGSFLDWYNGYALEAISE